MALCSCIVTLTELLSEALSVFLPIVSMCLTACCYGKSVGSYRSRLLSYISSYLDPDGFKSVYGVKSVFNKFNRALSSNGGFTSQNAVWFVTVCVGSRTVTRVPMLVPCHRDLAHGAGNACLFSFALGVSCRPIHVF